MKFLHFTLFLLVYSLLASAQGKTDLQRQKLKGSVKTLTEYEYEVIVDKKEAQKGSLRWKSVSNFDKDGKQVGFATYSADNALLSKSVYNFNDSGRLLDVKRYRADGGLNVKVIYKYDAKGNILEEENFDASGTMFMKGVNKYDVRDNRIVYDRFNQFGHLFLKSNYKFDKAGHEIQEREYDSHEALKYATTFEYSNFDKQGNWLQKITYKNDEPKIITEREIEYE
jgi:hypothetical protein